MSQGCDELISRINGLLPSRWVLNSITVTEADGYSVLLCPRGSVPIEELGRVYGRGETIRDALADALFQLDRDRHRCSRLSGNGRSVLAR